MAREVKYFAITLGPIGYVESYPAVNVNGREVMPAIPNGPNDSFYVHRSLKATTGFCGYISNLTGTPFEVRGPELYGDAIIAATSKSAAKKALSEYFAGIKLDQIRELL